MSSCILKVFPTDPNYVPSPQAQAAGQVVLKRLVPEAEDVRSKIHERPAFIDQGGNFDEVRCPACGKDLGKEWWTEAMDSAFQSQFTELATKAPCCGANTSLNDLEYDFPAGFARFVLEASDPNRSEFLSEEALGQLAGACQRY